MFSQNLEEKISLEICNCIGNLEGAKNAEEKIENCFKKGFENNFFQISEKLGDSDGKKTNDLDDYANSIEGVLLNNCTNFLNYAERDLRKPERKSISYCNDLKVGTYYYEALQGKEKHYLTFMGDKIIETRRNNIFSINKIEWLENCTYKLTLIETNSNYDEANLKNKPLIFKIIQNNEDYFVVQTKYFEKGGFNNVTIYKLPYLNAKSDK